jgi:competence protein ComEC
MRTAYFFGATLGFLAGVGTENVHPLPFTLYAVCALVACVLCFFFFLSSHEPYIIGSVCVIAFLLGGCRMVLAEKGTPHDLDQVMGTTALQGFVVREPDKRERSQLVAVSNLTNDTVPLRGIILATVSRHNDIRYGDMVTITGTLGRPQPFETEFGRMFAYDRFLLAQGITHTIPYAQVTVVSRDNGSIVLSALFSIKQRISTALGETLLEPESGLARGMLLGEKQSLGKEVTAHFRDSGLIHIVVLSGYNIAIVVLALMALLARTRLRVRAGIATCAIVLFALMVGPSATVVRASIMALLVLLTEVYGKTYVILRALMLSATGMVLWNPYLLVSDPGFHLSFLATLGLILIAPHFAEFLKKFGYENQLSGYVVATVSTQIMTLPYLMYAMGSVPLLAIVANVLVLPLVPLAMLFSALGAIATIFVPNISLIINYPADLILSYMVWISHIIANVPHTKFVLPPFSVLYMAGLYISILGVLMYMSKRTVATDTLSKSSTMPFPFA